MRYGPYHMGHTCIVFYSKESNGLMVIAERMSEFTVQKQTEVHYGTLILYRKWIPGKDMNLRSLWNAQKCSWMIYFSCDIICIFLKCKIQGLNFSNVIRKISYIQFNSIKQLCSTERYDKLSVFFIHSASSTTLFDLLEKF